VLREKFSEEILPKAPRGKDKFEITEEHSRFIRFLWTRWLNRLEGTLAAWDQRAANAPVLERNFEPLVRRSESQIKRLSTEEDLPITHKFLKNWPPLNEAEINCLFAAIEESQQCCAGAGESEQNPWGRVPRRGNLACGRTLG
jgi:hypothetical protein